MIRNANRNISVSRGHGYTVEKVKYAVDFINKAGRNTTIDDWVAAYNYIKGTNETATGCHKCAAAKYSASVRNYAQYGYLTLINEGHKPEEFKDEPEVSAETYTEQEKTPELNNTESQDVETETSPDLEVPNAEVPTKCNEEQQVPELAEQVETPIEEQPETVAEQEVEKPKVVKRNKGGRPKKAKK